MGEQDNTIRILSKVMGQNHNDQQMHDIHNSLFGSLLGSSGKGESPDLGSLLSQITEFINQQNQQIQTLITAIMKNVQQVTSQIRSSTRED